MTYQQQIQSWQKSGITKKILFNQQKSVQDLAKKFGGFVLNATMNGSLPLEAVTRVTVVPNAPKKNVKLINKSNKFVLIN